MKCVQCGFDNRAGVKFCENCGESLGVRSEKFCPSCGHKNRPGVRFCEECGATLGVAAYAAAVPSAQAFQSAPQPQVIVMENTAKKKRMNMLWLVSLLLLLLMSCCCLLLLLGKVTLPAFAAPIVNPVIEKMREMIPWGVLPNGDFRAPPPIPPEVCLPIVAGSDYARDWANVRIPYYWCEEGVCYLAGTGFEPFEDPQVFIEGLDGKKIQADCFYDSMNGENYFLCEWPDNDLFESSVSWKTGLCEYQLGRFLDEVPPPEPPQVMEPPDSEPNVTDQQPKCCASVQVEQPVYIRIPPPVGPLFLSFGVQCAEGWDFDPNTCATFDAYVGADRDIFWGSGECCPDPESPNRALGCEANIEAAGQKKSATQIQLRYGECYWEFEFQSPYYPPKESGTCPPGESMCAGSCCSTGHCCVCDGYLGCWENCSAPNCSP